MNILSPARLIDMLIEWRVHEGQVRQKLPPSTFAEQPGVLRAVEIILQTRSPIIGPLLAAVPVGCFKAEVTSDDLPNIRVFNGRSVDDYTAEMISNQGVDGEYVRGLANSDAAVLGPIVLVARGTVNRIGQISIDGPPIVYDGCHRLAAWRTHQTRGRVYPISAYLIVTKNQGPIFGVPPSHRPIAVPGLTMVKVVDGRITESSVKNDMIALLKQIGATKIP